MKSFGRHVNNFSSPSSSESLFVLMLRPSVTTLDRLWKVCRQFGDGSPRTINHYGESLLTLELNALFH
jgi:hypothetical protein